MKNIVELIEKLGLDHSIALEDIPNIDLYMDQVIQLFENTYGQSKRLDNDKVMTKTMINNYAKGKVFFPIENKKYSKKHLILLSFIYELKGALSINDIKTSLDGINKKIVEDDFDLESFYKSYLQIANENSNSFKVDVTRQVANVVSEGNHLPEEDQQVLLISSLIQTSNLYRRIAESLVDQLSEEKRK